MIFLLLAVLIVFLPDLYIWLSFVKGTHPLLSALYWLPTAVMVAALIAGTAGHYRDWALKAFVALALCVALPKLLFAILSLLGRGAGLLAPAAVPVAHAAGIALALIAAIAFAYGLTAGWKRLTVKELTISSPGLPAAFDGYRIVHLSDLHVGAYGGSPETVRRWVERIDALGADAILFTGDLVNSSADELDPFMDILSQLRARDGVFSVLGNHDYCLYRRYDTPDGAAQNTEELKRRERTLGWQLLLNEHRLVRRGRDSLAIVGVENDGKPPFPSLADLKAATAGLDAQTYKILLSHDPSHWRRSVLPESDIDLTLSGHTHAMQFRIGGFSPARWVYPEWGGLYERDGRALHVSAGLGGMLPFRLGAWPEVTVVTLRRTR